LSAILKFGTPAQKAAYVPDVIMGRKFIALAISEPNAGSDVAGLTCTATRTPDGYTLSGQKKWITNSTYAENFVLAGRVAGGGERHSGLAFFIVSKDAPEFTIRKVNVTGASISGTGYLVFKDTPIPHSALLGSEGQGFVMIMQNFVHERLYISTITIRLSRICLEESVRYAMRREAFGGKLADIQAIRLLVGQMAAKVEMMQAWLEALVDQVIRMGKKKSDTDLAATICLLKAECGDLYEFCANSATHVFGGHALVASGPGQRIEGAVAAVKAYTIPAGATLVMRDFGGKSIFKKSKL
jgi:alkylation response protein AidB-like acyl-CoA dehydrogenase